MAENREYLAAAQKGGVIHISEEVIVSIAAMAVMEVEGVYGVGPNPAPDLTDRLSKRGLGKSIRLAFEEESVTIACDVTLLFGYSVIEVAKKIQEQVTTAVASMTGCKVQGVDVNVCGITLPK